MDDTFVLWPHSEKHLESFHQHLNAQHPFIQFTMEKEQQCKIAFLDVLVERTSESFATRVYRKPTHTDRYINYASHHLISCLKRRANEICDEQSKNPEK